MTDAEAFAHPFTYWVGMDTDPRTTPEALAEFNRFYSTTHVHEVIAAHAGFLSVSRYELIGSEAGAGMLDGPRWLAVYEMADETAAEQYIRDNQRPWLHRKQYSPWPPARKKARIVWRMLWRRVSDPGAARAASDAIGLDERAVLDAIRLVGVNNPEAGLQSGGGTRLELYREFAHPAPGCPRFCEIVVADAAAQHSTQPGAGQPVWDLVYRRIPLPS